MVETKHSARNIAEDDQERTYVHPTLGELRIQSTGSVWRVAQGTKAGGWAGLKISELPVVKTRKECERNFMAWWATQTNPAPAENKVESHDIRITAIRPSELNPRKHFDDAALQELSESIKEEEERDVS